MRSVKRAGKVALLAGLALNAINHYELALGAPLTPELGFQVTVTFLAPFLVSLFGQLSVHS